MKLIVGLGNPGKQYEHTRHNVGFMAGDFLRQNFGGSEWEDSKFQGMLSKVRIPENRAETGIPTDTTLLFFLPLTFMNLSGNAVARLVHFYSLDPKNDILVLSDDIDMEFAKVRYREKGSHGGQNGLRDIIEKLGTSDFPRIKIGIGRHEQYRVSDWVLSKFTPEEKNILFQESLPKAKDYMMEWLRTHSR